MSIPIVPRNIREIPVGLIDGPELAMRDGFDTTEQRELEASIAQHGVRVALIVVARGDRYRVVAGDRRLHAARALGAVTVPCDVQEISDDDLEFVKVLENEDRAPVNAADAAAYCMRLYRERCGEDVDRVCAIVRRSRRWVEDRLILFAGDEKVYDALKADKISHAVALELNRIENDGYRWHHLDQALKYGMTKAAAIDARKSANFATANHGRPADTSGAATEAATTQEPSGVVCYICGRTDHRERMRYMTVHEHCDLAIGQRVLAAFKEPDAAPAATGD
jgi:ParB/RepB/Spo0J family partition protein